MFQSTQEIYSYEPDTDYFMTAVDLYYAQELDNGYLSFISSSFEPGYSIQDVKDNHFSFLDYPDENNPHTQSNLDLNINGQRIVAEVYTQTYTYEYQDYLLDDSSDQATEINQETTETNQYIIFALNNQIHLLKLYYSNTTPPNNLLTNLELIDTSTNVGTEKLTQLLNESFERMDDFAADIMPYDLDTPLLKAY